MGSCLCCVPAGSKEYLPIRDGAADEPGKAQTKAHKILPSKSTSDIKRSGIVTVKHQKNVVVARDASGNKLINQYLVCRTLDHGATGKVKLVLDSTSGEYFVR